MEDFIIREQIGPVVRLTLNRPASLNALSDEMIEALAGALAALAETNEARAVILRGAGRAFCAGHDLRQMQAARQAPDAGAVYFLDLFTRCARLMQLIADIPQPVIAEVHGVATAAGCQLAASCDMAIASEDARFGVNGVNLGLFCSTPMVALTRVIPSKIAFEMLTTGEFISAARALELGLLNRVVPSSGLSEACLSLAQAVAAKLPAAVRIGKRAFYQQQSLPPAEAYVLTARVMAENMMRADTAEGIQAFIDRRAPGSAAT